MINVAEDIRQAMTRVINLLKFRIEDIMNIQRCPVEVSGMKI